MQRNKVLLITGGTGSFGNAVLKRFLITDDFSEIRIYSRDELKQEVMRRGLNSNKVKFYLGDVRIKDSLYYAMKGVTHVLHAAALKQVPSCEFYPLEAVRTNILGTENVLDSAIENGIESLIVLSTDKSVYAINAMGMTKALAEKLMIAKSRLQSSTVLSATRYGNVMASRGSVIPLFVKQIKEGKPITITNPNMTRFLMSLDDSVDLVVYAFNAASTGNIFVKKAPACTMSVLVYSLLNIFSASNEIRIVGTRHGEKLYESLLTREEFAKAIDMGEYFKLPPDERGMNYDTYWFEGEEKNMDLEYNSHNTTRLEVDEVTKLLLSLDYIQQELKS